MGSESLINEAAANTSNESILVETTCNAGGLFFPGQHQHLPRSRHVDPCPTPSGPFGAEVEEEQRDPGRLRRLRVLQRQAERRPPGVPSAVPLRDRGGRRQRRHHAHQQLQRHLRKGGPVLQLDFGHSSTFT